MGEDRKIDGAECDRIKENFAKVVSRGREPGLMLTLNNGSEISLKEKGEMFISEMKKIVDFLGVDQKDDWHRILSDQEKKLANPKLTPSHKIFELSKKD